MMVFFFKQKTAYEMRISDWSSDVCSSDLSRDAASSDQQASWPQVGLLVFSWLCRRSRRNRSKSISPMLNGKSASRPGSMRCCVKRRLNAPSPVLLTRNIVRVYSSVRSEEHTSELQSLMRISYAVICMNKNKRHHI